MAVTNIELLQALEAGVRQSGATSPVVLPFLCDDIVTKLKSLHLGY